MITFLLYQFMRGLNLFILWFVVVMCGLNIVQVVLTLFITPAYIRKARHFEYRLIGASTNIIPISILVPAYNEEEAIVESVKSMLNLNFTNYEVVVINDGSQDNTLKAVISAFNLHKVTFPVRERLATKKIRGIFYNPDIPRLKLVDKENGGKSDALNAGINLSRFPYIVSLDADSLLEADALLRIAMAFMQHKYTIAVGGIIRVVNGCMVENGKVIEAALPKKKWALFQIVEYMRTFLVGRIGWNSINSLLVMKGAFGSFQKDAVISVGGYSAGTAGEDMDMIIKLHRYMRAKKYKYRVSFLPDPVCWTRVPESLDVLYMKRRRWQIGLMDVFGRYRDMFMNPRYGMLGMAAIPYMFFYEIVFPVVELLGYIMIPVAWYFGFLGFEALALFLIAVVFFGIFASLGSLVVEDLTAVKFKKAREVILLSFLGIAENVFYRQITSFFRLQGILSYRKYKQTLGIMRHKKQPGAKKRSKE